MERFGLITTNSIRQVWQRKVIETQLNKKNPIRLIFAIPDHPWTDGGAAVRIAMTGAELDELKVTKIAQLGNVFTEVEAEIPEEEAERVEINWRDVGQIFSNLQVGTNVAITSPLKSNYKLSSRGVQLIGTGFCLTKKEANNIESNVVHPYLNGRDLLQNSKNALVIDLFGFTENQTIQNYPKAYQWLYERVKPERDQNNRVSYRKNWWIFGEPRANLRPALSSIKRYIATIETAKHRVFIFLKSDVIPDNMLIAIALDDAYFLGTLSSRIHTTWALAAGGDLGGNTPRYNKTRCFDPFPFPDATLEQKQKIRDLGERLDAHRKRVQNQHPDVTITGMYNLLEKMRSGEPFSEKDREYNNKALVSTLKQIHDELDAAVFAAYGWQQNLSNDQILEQLVALNTERAEEERNGLIRWLRPEYQAPETMRAQSLAPLQGIIEGLETEEVAPLPVAQQALPKKFKEQVVVIRDLLRTSGTEWTLEQIVAQFKGATRSKKAISECLESLEELGVLASHTEAEVTRWYFAELQNVS